MAAFILPTPAGSASTQRSASAAQLSSLIRQREPLAASQFVARNGLARTFDVEPAATSFSVECACQATTKAEIIQRSSLSKKIDYHKPADIRQGYDPEDPHPAFTQVINELYPTAVADKDFLRQTYKALLKLGFSKVNTLPCATLCRDEICRPFGKDIEDLFCRAEENPEAGKFIFNALAGIMSSGRTAVKAAVSHAPMMDGYERYLFMSFPHIAIDYRGRVGSVRRPGRSETSHACGALLGLEDAFAKSALQSRPEIDMDDLEMSMLMRRFFDKIPRGSKPNLVELTDAALELAEETLDQIVPEVVASRRCHYAIVTGIQIHGPDGTNFIAPSRMYAVINGKRQEINVDFSAFAVTKASSAAASTGDFTSALEAASAAFEAASKALVVASKDKAPRAKKAAPVKVKAATAVAAAAKKRAPAAKRPASPKRAASPAPAAAGYSISAPPSYSTAGPASPSPSPSPSYSPAPAQTTYGISSPPTGYQPQQPEQLSQVGDALATAASALTATLGAFDTAVSALGTANSTIADAARSIEPTAAPSYGAAAPASGSGSYSIASPPAGYVPPPPVYLDENGYPYEIIDGQAYYIDEADAGNYAISSPPSPSGY